MLHNNVLLFDTLLAPSAYIILPLCFLQRFDFEILLFVTIIYSQPSKRNNCLQSRRRITKRASRGWCRDEHNLPPAFRGIKDGREKKSVRRQIDALTDAGRGLPTHHAFSSIPRCLALSLAASKFDRFGFSSSSPPPRFCE